MSILGIIFVLLTTFSFNIPLNENSTIKPNVYNSIKSSEELFGKLRTSSHGWTDTEVISTESTQPSYNPSIIADSEGNIHVVWSDQTDYGGSTGIVNLFYKYWNASSSIWTITEWISTESTGSCYNPSIDKDSDGNVHVVWVESTQIFYKKRNAVNKTWTATTLVSTVSTDNSYEPTIVIDSNSNIHIVWSDCTNYNSSGTDFDIFYKSWNATNKIWTSTKVVSTESTDDSYKPSIAIDGDDNVHIAWFDFTNYNNSGTDADIFYKNWNATSRTWTITELISTKSTIASYTPSIAVDNLRNIHIVWYDGAYYGIVYKRRDSVSMTWTTTELVSTESVLSLSITGDPSMVIDGIGNLHVVWRDPTNYSGSGTDFDIFYKMWNAVSMTWTTTEVVSTESSSLTMHHRIAVDSAGNVHVVWREVMDILYKKKLNFPEAPLLNPILPNPDYDGKIDLNWTDVNGAVEYYVYRDTKIILSVNGMGSIAKSSNSSFTDTVMLDNNYFYVIVAENIAGNSSISNCESVLVKLTGDQSRGISGYNTLVLITIVSIVSLIGIKKWSNN